VVDLLWVLVKMETGDINTKSELSNFLRMREEMAIKQDQHPVLITLRHSAVSRTFCAVIGQQAMEFRMMYMACHSVV
jgi:hypothetical protein